jgi:acetyl esterase
MNNPEDTMTSQRDRYRDIIDDETWAFIDHTNSFYPPTAVSLSIPEQRAAYDAMCREFFAGYPKGVTVADQTINGVPTRTYRKGKGAAALVLYFHGGGFVVGGLDSHDDVCAEICARTGYRVVSVDYRLWPEHRHPAAFSDCMAVFEAMAGAGAPIVLAGDSAGGNLAAAVAHATKGRADAPIGQVLVYPGLGGDIDQGSYLAHSHAPLLGRADIIFYRNIREVRDDVKGDATYAPLWAADFSGLPPTVAISAECDPVSDDGRDYCDHVRAAGGKAHWVNEAGLVHGYLRARHSVARARASFTRIVEAIAALGRGDWPY